MAGGARLKSRVLDEGLVWVQIALVGAELAREEARGDAKSFAGKLRSHKSSPHETRFDYFRLPLRN